MELMNNDHEQENPPLHFHVQPDPPPQESKFDREFNLLLDHYDPYYTTLLSKENSGYFDPPGQVPEDQKLWIERARLWMLQLGLKCGVDFGLRYRTACMGMVYYERFISLKWSIMRSKPWSVKPVGAACLVLAAETKEGPFPELAVAAMPMLNILKHKIHDFKLDVIRVLEGRMTGLITPINFMHFFIRKFGNLPYGDGRGGGGFAPRTAAFIFTAMKVTGTLEYRPSVVAAAATLAAMDPTLSKTALEQRLAASGVFDHGFTATAEQVHRCYALINRLNPYQELAFPHRPQL